MGTLTKYSLAQVSCNIFIETGTGTGGTLKHALESKVFEKLYSVEIHKESAEQVKKELSSFDHVKIFNSTSTIALKDIFPLLRPSDRAFFFLDAHFPGEFYETFSGYEGITIDKTSLPLEEELELIKFHRGNCEDIIVIDDLRLYEQGPFERGNLQEGFGGIPMEMRNIDFVHRIFGDRSISKDYRDEGYLIICPSSINFSLKRLGAMSRLKRNFRKHFSL
jgi:hypothetical protein